MKVVVVESPAKAKTINKYLGPGYHVLASYGHVRDLPPKDGSVRPDEEFAMDWDVDERARKRIDDIAKAVKGAESLYLATDPDREGEAISWHVREVLEGRKVLKDVDVSRVVFHEVTRNAVLDAIANPRELNRELIDAYLARRALDYLVGFTLSPVLWRKLPGSRSAGRVQSVALRLVCEREAEIEAFRAREFWTVEAGFLTPKRQPFTARLTHLEGRKLDKFDLPNEAAAQAAVDRIRSGRFDVAEVEKKQVRRHPQPPFTTSTLQQEASRKLRLGASRTMRVAQRLYEGVDLGGETVGLISYMRTDSVALSQEALAGCRALIGRDYGAPYLPEKPRTYRNSARNAQEAHEAIRPTDVARRPADLRRHLEPEMLAVYELIWKRTVASQMESARLDQVAVDVAADGGRTVLRATGSVIVFDGFLKLYQEGRDDPGEEEGEEGRRLPPVESGDPLETGEVTPEQHFTQPPPRYTEASLVKKMEELGIGRPSTYASIMQVLQDRDYVRLEARRFVPEDRGRLVTAFLSNFFDRYVQYNFTADLEQKLDDVSNGRMDWRQLLREFWDAFRAKIDGTRDLSISEVLKALDEDLGPHFFPVPEDGGDPRACPACAGGRLGLKLGRHGAFIGCTNYPECRYTRPLGLADPEQAANSVLEGSRVLGEDPATGLPVSLRKGPYGLYVQLGEEAAPPPKDPEAEPPADGEAGKGRKKTRAKAKDKAPKPKRASLPRGVTADTITLETALGLLSLPREIGLHPESGEMIYAGLGRFGPYLKHQGAFKSLPADDDVLTVGINRAVDLLAQAKAGGGVLRELGMHPAGGPVTIHKGRFGPYLKHKKVMASLPKGGDPETITMEEAVPLLAARAARAGGGAKRGGKAAGAGDGDAAAKPVAKPKSAAPKKAAAKKAAPKKAAGTRRKAAAGAAGE